MADNVAITAGLGTTIAADDIGGGVYAQRVKMVWGADGTGTDVATAGSAVPIQDGGNSITVDGTVAVSGTVTVAGAVTNAGTFVVQENGAALTALQIIDNTPLQEDSAHSSGDFGVMALAVRTATAPTDKSAGSTNGDYEPMQVDANGRLYVNATLYNSSGTELTSHDFAEDSAHSSGDQGTMLLAVRESTATDLSAGATNGDYEPLQVDASGQLWVNAGAVTPGTGATALGKAEDAAHTTGDVGVMALAVRASAPTERSAGPTDGDYEPLGVNEVGAVWGTMTPSANGGCTTFMASGSDGSSILVATAQAIKASAGVMYGYYAYNPEAAVTFVHFYNIASGSVTVGTNNPLFTIAIPAGSAANLTFPYGIAFSNAGWSCSATTTAGGSTAPATGVSLVVWYK